MKHFFSFERFRRRKYRWSRSERIILLEQLEMYVSAGLSVPDCFSIMCGVTVSPRKCVELNNVRKQVESGGLLSQALFEYIGFSKSLTSIVEHGEKIGGIRPSLKSAHDLLNREDELIKKSMSAMTYPIIIGVLAVFLTIGLMRGVVPQIVPMLTGMKMELPILTKVTIWMSGAIVSYGIYFVIMMILKIGVGLFIYRKFVPVKKIVHIFILRTPIIGKIVYLYSISIFLRSFGTLVSSGISIDIAYSEVVETISVLPLKAYFVSRRANISGGSQLQTIFSDKRIPAHVSALVSAGQMSGLLGESLIRAANIIDVDLENQFKRLTSFIEPLMMVGVGGVVGVIALSIMMPIYDMSKVLQHA